VVTACVFLPFIAWHENGKYRDVINVRRKGGMSVRRVLLYVRYFEDILKIIRRHNCNVRGSVDQQMRKASKMMALLRTTDCAVVFPRLPPFCVLVGNIQHFALGE
jgi:hypothetical protein